ncbi:TonB-dependent receptor plug domain-containing protein [Salegentibacter chungangensis]|uniref:TonB-dependent receptor plug domain-containing protein n=1 Tax=Salegentibacter chungangensis TaxID=1335724 RepID=A0ABW3NNS4_9FLAO
MRILTALVFLILGLGLQAQEITVLDKDSGEPVSGVVILNKEKTRTLLTDIFGKADISGFKVSEKIYFQHISHHELIITKKEILKNKGLVFVESDENKLDEVILSVAKFELEKDEVPQKILSIGPSDIQLAAPQTSADLLESTGQVFVQKSQLGGGSPMIRGFATNRLLITVDGVRMNTAIFRSGNLQNVISIDPLAIQKTEVILGPGSVVYGSDAVGGVMNFYTLKPKFSFGRKTSFSGNAYSRYATANDEKTFHTDFNIGRENWAFLTSVTYSDFGDMKMGSYGPGEYLREEYAARQNGQDVILKNHDPEVQKPTGYKQLNLLEKIKYMPTENWNFSLGLIYSTTSDYPRFDRLYRKRDGQLRSGEWYYGPQNWFLGNFKINKKGRGQIYDKAQFTAAYQFFEESRHDRDFGEEILFNTKENVDAWSGNLDFEKTFENSKLFYGAEYVLNKVGSVGSTENILSGETGPNASRYPDGSTWQSLAAYTTYQLQVNEDLSFQSGLRYNQVMLKADFDQSFYEFPFDNADINTGALTGSAGVHWHPSGHFGWRLNLSTAFRAPNIDDIGKIFDSEPGSVVVPNPDLKPEYAYNGEIGMDWTPAENIRFGMTGFFTHLNDAMVRRDFSLDGETEIEYQGEPSRVQAIQNASSAYVYGFEAMTEIDISVALRFSSVLSYTQGEEEQDNGSTAPLRHAAPLFGNTQLTWHKKRLKLNLFAEYNGEISYRDLAPSERGKAYLYATNAAGNPYSPSWYTLNLSGRYEISESWKAGLVLENITDQRYRTYSSGIAAAGRNFILSLSYDF